MPRQSKHAFGAARLIDWLIEHLPQGMNATVLGHDLLYASEAREARMLIYADDVDDVLEIDVVCEHDITFSAQDWRSKCRNAYDMPEGVLKLIEAWRKEAA